MKKLNGALLQVHYSGVIFYPLNPFGLFFKRWKHEEIPGFVMFSRGIERD